MTVSEWVTPTGEVTQNGELSFGGILLGRNAFRLQSLEGWDDSVEYDLGNVPRPAAHGSFLGGMLGQTRLVTATYQAVTREPTTLQLAVADIRRVTVPTDVESELVIQLGEERHLVYARCIRRSIPADRNHAFGMTQVVLQFEATDPRRYSPEEFVSSTLLPVTEAGVAFPWTFPVTFTAPASSDGDLEVIHVGDVPTPALMTVAGGTADDLAITCSTGWRLDFDLALADDDVLVIDPRTGQVLLNGVSRAGALTGLSSPVEDCLLPVGESVVAFRGVGTATLTLTYRSAFM